LFDGCVIKKRVVGKIIRMRRGSDIQIFMCKHLWFRANSFVPHGSNCGSGTFAITEAWSHGLVAEEGNTTTDGVEFRDCPTYTPENVFSS
jgi:hypothetical protein